VDASSSLTPSQPVPPFPVNASSQTSSPPECFLLILLSSLPTSRLSQNASHPMIPLFPPDAALRKHPSDPSSSIAPSQRVLLFPGSIHRNASYDAFCSLRPTVPRFLFNPPPSQYMLPFLIPPSEKLFHPSITTHPTHSRECFLPHNHCAHCPGSNYLSAMPRGSI
jgi:hypothetical protein